MACAAILLGLYSPWTLAFDVQSFYHWSELAFLHGGLSDQVAQYASVQVDILGFLTVVFVTK